MIQINTLTNTLQQTTRDSKLSISSSISCQIIIFIRKHIIITHTVIWYTHSFDNCMCTNMYIWNIISTINTVPMFAFVFITSVVLLVSVLLKRFVNCSVPLIKSWLVDGEVCKQWSYQIIYTYIYVCNIYILTFSNCFQLSWFVPANKLLITKAVSYWAIM